MYKLSPKNISGEQTNVIRTIDGACIPFDQANQDAVEFCKWLKNGGIPEAEDGGTTPTQEEINAIITKLS
jgi:hypothetical protein